MIKFFYKRIIAKLNLSREQLLMLKNKLIPESICSGPFFTEQKMCPTTTGLALKLNVPKLDDKAEIYAQFRSFGARKIDFYLLYIVFDLPSLFSDRFFKYSLDQMKKAVDEITRSIALVQ